MALIPAEKGLKKENLMGMLYFGILTIYAVLLSTQVSPDLSLFENIIFSEILFLTLFIFLSLFIALPRVDLSPLIKASPTGKKLPTLSLAIKLSILILITYAIVSYLLLFGLNLSDAFSTLVIAFPFLQFAVFLTSTHKHKTVRLFLPLSFALYGLIFSSRLYFPQESNLGIFIFAIVFLPVYLFSAFIAAMRITTLIGKKPESDTGATLVGIITTVLFSAGFLLLALAIILAAVAREFFDGGASGLLVPIIFIFYSAFLISISDW